MDRQTIRLIFIHLLVLNVIWTGTSAIALWLTLFFFCWRGIFLSISYHRYFSHRSYKTTRGFQFFLAMAGSICMQRGALWWASHHRFHHQYSDTEKDPHSPVAHSFFHSHIGWAMEKKSFITDYSRVKDFDKFPELKKLNEHSDAVHAVFAALLFISGELLRYFKPELGANGFQFLVWVYLIGGLCHLHTIFAVNSWGHLHGDGIMISRHVRGEIIVTTMDGLLCLLLAKAGTSIITAFQLQQKLAFRKVNLMVDG